MNKNEKTIICHKCKEEYDANYKRCPKCGHSNTIDVVLIVLTALLIIWAATASTITLIKTIKLEKTINSAITSETSEGIYGSLDIKNQSYYASYELNDENKEDVLSQFDNYILYFHKENCDYCKEANYFIDQYITLGYAGYMPVLFVMPDTGESICKEYNVSSTPTAFVVEGEEISLPYEGSNAIWELFDGIVSSLSGE